MKSPGCFGDAPLSPTPQRTPGGRATGGRGPSMSPRPPRWRRRPPSPQPSARLEGKASSPGRHAAAGSGRGWRPGGRRAWWRRRLKAGDEADGRRLPAPRSLHKMAAPRSALNGRWGHAWGGGSFPRPLSPPSVCVSGKAERNGVFRKNSLYGRCA